MPFPSPAPGPVSVVIVSPEGDGQFTSIQAAIEAAAPGTEITVRPGKYRETLRIDKPLRVIGAGSPEDVIVSTRTHAAWSWTRTKTWRSRSPLANGRGQKPRSATRSTSAVGLRCWRIVTSARLRDAAWQSTTRPSRPCGLHPVRQPRRGVVPVRRRHRLNWRIAHATTAGRASLSPTVAGRRWPIAIFKRTSPAGVYLSRAERARFEDCRIVGNVKAGAVIGPGGKGLPPLPHRGK